MPIDANLAPRFEPRKCVAKDVPAFFGAFGIAGPVPSFGMPLRDGGEA